MLKAGKHHAVRTFLPGLGALCAATLGAGGLAAGPAGAASSDINQWGEVFSNPSAHHNYRAMPTPVQGLSGVTAIQAGNSDGYALAGGSVWAWGFGTDGELGDGQEVNSFSAPVEVAFPLGTEIVALGESFDNGYAIDSEGNGWAWGANHHGSLCLGEPGSESTPAEVTGLPGPVTAVAGGESHVLWLGANGHVYACGKQPFGQLGNGTVATAHTPVEVKGLPEGDPVVAISAGDNFSAALTQSGRLYMWGSDDFGQLGNGTMREAVVRPVQVPGSFSQVDLGGGSGADPGRVTGADSSHTLAITTTGTVEAWGNDSSGQLGDGLTRNEDSPVAVDVPAGVAFVKLAAAGVSSAALDSNGNVWTWGADGVRQLGNGEAGPPSLAPIEVDHGKTMLSGTADNLMDG